MPVLVVRAGALGDLLLLRPAIATLVNAGKEVWLLSPESGRWMLEEQRPLLSGWLDFDDPRFAANLGDPRSPWPATWPRFDSALVVTGAAAVMAAIRPHAPRLLLVGPRPDPGFHASDHYVHALREWGLSPLHHAPILVPADAAMRAALPLLRELPPRFVAIHPGSGSTEKNWPVERFAALLTSLPAGEAWLLLEGPADEGPASALARLAGARVARRLPIPVVAALLSRAAVYLGNDSGITHLAAATGTSTFALFGSTDPATWGPRGPRVHVIRAPSGDLSRLEVEEVRRQMNGLDESGNRQILRREARAAAPEDTDSPRHRRGES